MGTGLELDVITGVVLGGTSIFGGRGTIIGTVLGLILIQALKNGLALSGVKGDGTIVVIGVVLIARDPDRRAIRQEQRRLNSGGRLPRHPPVGTETNMGANDMKKLTLAVLLSLGLMSGSALAASAWTGGDDLPTNPLACDATPGAAVAKPYDGGVPTNPPDRKGKKITVVDVPKLIGIGYFNATSKGISDAAAELGNVDAKTDGPTKANIDEQITFIDNYITSGVDGILFAANDPVAIAPVLKKALEKGINVVGYDANSDARRPPVVRQPGRVQRHRQGAGRQHGRRDRRGRRLRHRHLDLHHAEPGALDRRDGRLCRRSAIRR